ncbi:Hypothetical predicted protein [Pelobates cultripes]|uniref:Uncharacterized protein n=1 Tax=Pelobates cultripes TaxID=61616 RepID=A0AAD1QYM6_PELCU|nr:Hypothetical predicted protein [Pelobates cultripes]
MSDSPQQTQDFQSIINAAVAASMEKAISKILMHLPPKNPTQPIGVTAQDTEDIVGSEASIKGLPPLPKRHKNGLTGPKSKGKEPINRPRHVALPKHPPHTLSSGEEDDYIPTSLVVVDKWQAEDSELDRDDEWQDVPFSYSKFTDDNYAEGYLPHDKRNDFASEDEEIFLDTKGCLLFDPRTIRHPQ